MTTVLVLSIVYVLLCVVIFSVESVRHHLGSVLVPELHPAIVMCILASEATTMVFWVLGVEDMDNNEPAYTWAIVAQSTMVAWAVIAFVLGKIKKKNFTWILVVLVLTNWVTFLVTWLMAPTAQKNRITPHTIHRTVVDGLWALWWQSCANRKDASRSSMEI